MQTASDFSLSDYIVPGEALTPFAARVRAYAAFAVGDDSSAEYLIECGVRGDQRDAVNDICLAMNRVQS